MSYSFSVSGKDKAEAKALVEQQIDEVIKSQPTHAQDKAVVIATSSALIDFLVSDTKRPIVVSCSGSLTWDSEDKEPKAGAFRNASVNCNAYLG